MGIYYGPDVEAELTQDVIDMVMLEIAYSPVIPYPGGQPCEVMELKDGMYLVLHNSAHPAQGAEKVMDFQLKVMRARYLLREGHRKSLALKSWLGRDGSEAD